MTLSTRYKQMTPTRNMCLYAEKMINSSPQSEYPIILLGRNNVQLIMGMEHNTKTFFPNRNEIYAIPQFLNLVLQNNIMTRVPNNYAAVLLLPSSQRLPIQPCLHKHSVGDKQVAVNLEHGQFAEIIFWVTTFICIKIINIDIFNHVA